MTIPDRSIARVAITWGLMLVFLIGGCASRTSKDGPPRSGSVIGQHLPSDPVPRSEPRSRYGNGPVYEVRGKRYRVMKSSYGYQERGVASWYGKKFHGRATSSQETYDMHAMTAAHKTLPLPTYVEVRNLRNNKTVIVRVNDRGPFVDNRIIDLSYSAARKLDMLAAGASLVEITAISFDREPPPQVRQQSTTTTVPVERKSTTDKLYVQVGAFGDQSNARRRFSLLRKHGIRDAFVFEETGRSPTLYRVRIGPIANVKQYDIVVAKLEQIGIAETHLVTD